VAKSPRGFWPITNGGEGPAIDCHIFLWLVTAGAGPWSLDRLLEKTKPDRPESSLTMGAAVR
jgi:uncharacterized membrane protein YphA (DoxX/SURF4 family)